MTQSPPGASAPPPGSGRPPPPRPSDPGPAATAPPFAPSPAESVSTPHFPPAPGSLSEETTQAYIEAMRLQAEAVQADAASRRDHAAALRDHTEALRTHEAAVLWQGRVTEELAELLRLHGSGLTAVEDLVKVLTPATVAELRRLALQPDQIERLEQLLSGIMDHTQGLLELDALVSNVNARLEDYRNLHGHLAALLTESWTVMGYTRGAANDQIIAGRELRDNLAALIQIAQVAPNLLLALSRLQEWANLHSRP